MPGQTLSPRATAWLGALFGVVGLVILLVAPRVIPADESKFRAPHWVVGAAGLAFFLVGISAAGDSQRAVWPPST